MFPIIEVPPSREVEEARGSKTKFWVSLEDGGPPWLLKFPREGSGEHWSEKLAAEVGILIGVDCATVELARCDGQLATICRSFTVADTPSGQSGENRGNDLYVHGMDVMPLVVENYDTGPHSRFRQLDHNVENICVAVERLASALSSEPEATVRTVSEALVSYALLDGLIGNTDRHHENWMLRIGFRDGSLHAAPSFDHASSLGRELTDDDRRDKLDRGTVLQYLRRGRGGVYQDDRQPRAPAPLMLAQWLCERWSTLARPTLDRIEGLSESECRTIIDRVPSEFMSEAARKFALQVLMTSKTELERSIR